MAGAGPKKVVVATVDLVDLKTIPAQLLEISGAQLPTFA